MFQTLVSLNMLRDQGCDLPIELFYADDEELDEADKVCLELTLNVTCINIQTIPEFQHYNARNFSIKAIALYLSSFDETLWMDADIIPLMNFEDLFKHEHYTTHHHIFFNDIFGYDRYENAKTKRLIYFELWNRVSVQGVKSLGGHFACLCRVFEFYEVKTKLLLFFKKKMEILLHF